MSKTIQITPVRKSIVVSSTAERAFAVFTSAVDRWWPKGMGIGTTPIRESVIEPFVGGRWYTKHEDDALVVIGHVREWQPGEKFVVSWEINGEWKPEARAELASEVEVRFVPAADGRTRVELEHRKFENMAAGGEKMRNEVDGGWPGLLELYGQEVAKAAS